MSVKYKRFDVVYWKCAKVPVIDAEDQNILISGKLRW